MRSDLAQLMATAAEIRDRADADRRTRDRDRLRAIAGNPESPVELSPRGNSFTALAQLVELRTPATAFSVARVRTPADDFEQLERRLLALVAATSPTTWASVRRPLTRVLRATRHELRALERRHSLT